MKEEIFNHGLHGIHGWKKCFGSAARPVLRKDEEGRDDPAVVVPVIRPFGRAAIAAKVGRPRRDRPYHLGNSDDRGGIVPTILGIRTTAAGSSLPFEIRTTAAGSSLPVCEFGRSRRDRP